MIWDTRRGIIIHWNTLRRDYEFIMMKNFLIRPTT